LALSPRGLSPMDSRENDKVNNCVSF